MAILLFSLPLLLQFVKSQTIQIWAIWGGIFLVLQTFLTSFITDNNYKTLPPNMNQTIDVIGGLPGIEGIQNITTDAKGYRTTKDIDYNNKNTFRIFAIGGSTTEQIFLDDQATWTHLLQEKIQSKNNQSVEVINTGVSGLRADHHLSTLKHVSNLNADMAIFLLGINDWNQMIKSACNGEMCSDEKQNDDLFDLLRQYRLEETMLGKVISLVSALILHEKVEGTVKESGDYYTHQRNSLNRATSIDYKPQTVHQDYKNTLSAISKQCKESNMICMFVSQPHGYQQEAPQTFKESFWMTPPNEEYALSFDSMQHIADTYNQYLKEFTQKQNHPFCDAASAMSASFDHFYDDCHFNTNGAKKMAEILQRCM